MSLLDGPNPNYIGTLPDSVLVERFDKYVNRIADLQCADDYDTDHVEFLMVQIRRIQMEVLRRKDFPRSMENHPVLYSRDFHNLHPIPSGAGDNNRQ